MVMSKSLVACSKQVPLTIVMKPHNSVATWRCVCLSCPGTCDSQPFAFVRLKRFL